jgi:hypothetical protein
LAACGVKREERNFNQPTEKSVAARRVCEIYYIWLDYAKSRGRGLILAPLFWAIQSIYRNQTNVNLMEVSNRIEIDIPKKRCENEPPDKSNKPLLRSTLRRQLRAKRGMAKSLIKVYYETCNIAENLPKISAILDTLVVP